MARARNIKPGLFKNEILGVADPLYTLLFEGLWVLADRDGRLEDRPLRIKGEIFPYRDNVDVEAMLTWLQGKDRQPRDRFIVRYEVDGQRYIQIINFQKHQNPHKNENTSCIPAYIQHDTESTDLFGTGTEKPGSTRADSLVLIPDSYTGTFGTLSGKPDHSKLNGKKAEAIAVLEFLNAQTGRAYRPVETNLKLIIDRLKEGYTAADMRKVIVRKCAKWKGDEKMDEYLRPATLFAKRNMAQYTGELVVPK